MKVNLSFAAWNERLLSTHNYGLCCMNRGFNIFRMYVMETPANDIIMSHAVFLTDTRIDCDFISTALAVSTHRTFHIRPIFDFLISSLNIAFRISTFLREKMKSLRNSIR